MSDRWASAKKGVVILHCFPRSRYRPSASPFAIKLETFLRMSKIAYELDHSKVFSSKGKTPWITLDNVDVADSHFAQQHLAAHFSKNFSEHLSKEQLAMAHTIRITLEDHLYFVLLAYYTSKENRRFVKHSHPPMETPALMRPLIFTFIMRNLGNQAKAQGVGRHSLKELEQLAFDDLKSVSDLLDNKPYLMGEEPSEIDCVVFGFVALLLGGDPEDHTPMASMIDKFDNLKSHFERMKNEFWPDWDQCLSKE